VYTWTDGSPLDFTRWDAGEPSDADGTDDCIRLRPLASGDWNDLPCDEQQPYICRLP
jgi:hypothetical protein